MQTKIFTGYKPRIHQEFIHNNLRRFNVLVCHRRFGKTVMLINEMIFQALRNMNKNPVYAYCSPTYSMSKKIAWQYLKDFCRDIPNYTANEAELRVTIDRPERRDKVTLILLGADNPDSLRGMYFDMWIGDEFGLMDPDLYGTIVRPALADRFGTAIFAGTPAGRNHFKSMLDRAKEADAHDWFSCIMRASETGVIIKSELDEARKSMTEEQYEQEFECDFGGSLSSAYFGKEMKAARKENRIRSVPYDKAKPTFTYWDLGVSDSTTVWFFQEIYGEYRFLDYHEGSNVSLDAHWKIVSEKEYWYSEHILPHDAAARDLSTGRSREELFRDMVQKSGKKQRVTVLPRYNVADTINAAKMIFNKCYFDAEKCKRGIDALENYQRKWDPKNLIWSDAPLHNWASNGADSFRMFAMSYREEASKIKESDLQREYKTDYDIYEY